MKIVKFYRYLFQVLEAVIKGERVPIDEFNILGGRKSAKSVSVQWLYGMLLNLPIKVGLFAIRASIDGAKEFLNDTVETLEFFEIPHKVNYSKMTISSKFNTIRFIGLNSLSKSTAKKSGLARVGNTKYIFKYYEERFEFTTKDYQAMQEAIRGMDNSVQMVTLNICNPWAKNSPYIAYCAKYQEWDINILKETGSQLGIYEEVDPETGILVRKLFHYTNWRVARDVLSTSEINEIRNTWNIDRNRAMTTDYGLPGYESGAIYTHLLHKISPAVLTTEAQYYIAGMDYGWSQREIGGKTACYFGTANLENGVDIWNEYVHDNALYPKDTNQVAKEIVEFYMVSVQQYCEKANLLGPPQIVVRVDNMAVGVITLLNNFAQQYRVNHWLRFVKCRKYPIQDRISITTALMGQQWLRVDKSCKNLMQEFELAHYEETETQKRAKENDHSINAFEYAIEGVMFQLARHTGNSKIANRLGRESKIW